MSRGLGKHQKAILELLENQGETTFESLRWRLWESDAKYSPGDDLPAQWNTKIKRALTSLRGHTDRVQISDKKLSSVALLSTHYPHKTLNGELRELRQKLLPTIETWLGTQPRYTTHDNEAFHIQSMSPEELSHIRLRWSGLEPKLFNLLSSLDSQRQSTVFLMMAKAKAIFDGVWIKVAGAFAEHVEQCEKLNCVNAKLQGELNAVSAALLPKNQKKHLRFKSFVHRCVHVPHHGNRYSMKSELVSFLAKQCSNVLESLPGYEPPETPPEQTTSGRRRHFLHLKEAVQSNLLDKVFDNSVFKTFQFVSLTD